MRYVWDKQPSRKHKSCHLPLAYDILARTERFQPQMKALLTVKMTNVYDLKSSFTELFSKVNHILCKKHNINKYLSVTQRFAKTQITAPEPTVEAKSRTQSTKYSLEAIAD